MINVSTDLVFNDFRTSIEILRTHNTDRYYLCIDTITCHNNIVNSVLTVCPLTVTLCRNY